MIISMSFKILAVTNSNLTAEDFLLRIKRIAESNVDGVILREKKLTEREYGDMASEVLKICMDRGTHCILHSHFRVAEEYNCRRIHLPLLLLRDMNKTEVYKEYFHTIGVSTHSVEEALEAEELGATYITAGHIFATDCKKVLKPRGLDYLSQVVKAVNIPVYAIGGIDESNVHLVKKTGAAGACIMSGIMTCQSPKEYVEKMKTATSFL